MYVLLCIHYLTHIVTAAKILEHMVLNGPSGATESAQAACSGEVVGHIKEAVAEKDKPHRDVVKKFGLACRKITLHSFV